MSFFFCSIKGLSQPILFVNNELVDNADKVIGIEMSDSIQVSLKKIGEDAFFQSCDFLIKWDDECLNKWDDISESQIDSEEGLRRVGEDVSCENILDGYMFNFSFGTIDEIKNLKDCRGTKFHVILEVEYNNKIVKDIYCFEFFIEL